MKRPILFVVLAVITVTGFSQTKKEKNLRDNFKITQSILTPLDYIPKTLDSRAQVIIELLDVNTFLYSITMKEVQRDNVNNEDITSSEYKTLFKPSDYKISEIKFNDFLLPPIDNSTVVDSVNSFEREIKVQKELATSLIKELADLERTKENLITKETLVIEKQFGDSSSNDKKIALIELKTSPKATELMNINTKIKEVSSLVQKADNKIEELKTERDGYLHKSKNNEAFIATFSEQLIEYLDLVSSVNDKVDFYTELLFLLFSNEPFQKIESDKQLLLQKYFGDNVHSSNIINSCNDMFDNLDKKYFDLMRTYANMPDNKKIETSYKKLSNFHNTIDEQKYQELFKQTLKIQNAINVTNWTINYQTTDISDKADKIYYSISFNPIKNDYALTTKSMSLNYDFDIKGGVKIDVSAGIFYNFNLYDDKYRFEKESDSTTLIVKENNNSQFTPSFGALFNVYKRTDKNIKLALNFGAATNIEKLYYYLGGSVLFGKSERIGINGGIVGGTVKRISSEYKDLERINLSIDQLPNEVPMQTNDPFQIGYFIGVSYNLSGKNKEKMELMLKQ